MLSYADAKSTRSISVGRLLLFAVAGWMNHEQQS